MARPTPLSGFPEWLPAGRVVEQHVLDVLRRTFELHGYAGIETRAVEPLDQLLRKGETSKEVYVVRRLQEGAGEQAETERFVLERQKLTTTHVTQTAMAQRDADKARADGRAYEIKVQGDAQAEAVRVLGQSLASNPLVIEYRKIEKWHGTFPTTFMGGEQGVNMLWSLPGGGPPPAARGAQAPNARPQQ